MAITGDDDGSCVTGADQEFVVVGILRDGAVHLPIRHEGAVGEKIQVGMAGLEFGTSRRQTSVDPLVFVEDRWGKNQFEGFVGDEVEDGTRHAAEEKGLFAVLDG
jgi:hypothetical protein